MTTRRDFLKHSALGAAGLTIGGLGFSTESFANIMGANEKIRVGIVGFSDRARHSLIPAFMACADELGFEIVAISDIWKRRREEGVAFFQEKYGKKVKAFRNNEELYDAKMCDAVIVATSDFQHALHCIEAVQAGCDAYVEKPFAETMEDARAARKAVPRRGAWRQDPAGAAPHTHTFFQIRRAHRCSRHGKYTFSAPSKGERGTVPALSRARARRYPPADIPEAAPKAPRRTCPYPPGRSTPAFSRGRRHPCGRCPRSRWAAPARGRAASRACPAPSGRCFPASASRGSACRRSKASVCNFASGNSLLFLAELSIAHLNTSSIYFSIFSVFLLNLPIRSNLFTFCPEFVHEMFTL